MAAIWTTISRSRYSRTLAKTGKQRERSGRSKIAAWSAVGQLGPQLTNGKSWCCPMEYQITNFHPRFGNEAWFVHSRANHQRSHYLGSAATWASSSTRFAIAVQKRFRSRSSAPKNENAAQTVQRLRPH